MRSTYFPVRRLGLRQLVAIALVPTVFVPAILASVFIVTRAHATVRHGVDVELGGEFEPAIAVNPINPLNVAVATAGRLRVSVDGGQTFGPAVVPVFPGTHELRGDPSLAFDRSGRLFWCYTGGIYLRQANEGLLGRDVFIARCDPETGSVLPGYPVNATVAAGMPGADGYAHDKPWLAVDAGASSPFADRLYIVWDDGLREYISHSTDQGATWSSGVLLETPDPLTQLLHVATAPNGDVYVAEHRGISDGVTGHVVVFRSTDGGGSFPQQSLAYSPGQADITANVQTTNATIPGVKFLLGGSMQPWILPDPLVPGRIHVIACDDPDNDLHSGDPSNIYITTSIDYGQTWDTPRRVDSGPAGTLQAMPSPAIDPATGKIVLHYYDNRAGALNEGGDYLLDVFTTSSTDGGRTFRPDEPINDLPFDPDPGAMCRVGCGTSIFDVWVATDQSALAVGNSSQVLRFDGSTWTAEYLGPQGYNRVWGTAANDVFVVGASGRIYHYNGSSWTSQESGTTQNLYGLHGRSSSDVFAVGAGGTILHYNGTTWSSVASGTTQNLFGVWMSPSGKAYAGGAGGTLLVFDGVWTPVQLGTSERVNDLWGTADYNVYAVGGHGSVFHFDGSAWSSTPSGLPFLLGIWGSSETDVFAVGWGIVHFDGSTWSYSAFTDDILTRVHGSSQGNVLVVGYSARIGRFDGTSWGDPEPNPWLPPHPTPGVGEYNGMTISGAMQYAVWCGNMFDQQGNPVEQQMIVDALDETTGVPETTAEARGGVLEAARPNPFRRSTSIAFELPSAERVRVSVHDVAGRTVAVLAEGQLSAGRHAVSWDGRDGAGGRVGSGVYFLRLYRDGQARTSKLVFVE